MPYFEEGSEAMLQLEAMVDRVGIRNVLYALAHICDAKANHILENWQDRVTAKMWTLDANKLNRCARACQGPAAHERTP